MSGAGAAGVAIAKMLLAAGIGDILLCDRTGVVGAHRDGLTDVKSELARITNREGVTGSLFDAMRGADVFIGVSSGTVPVEVVASMAPEAIVFSLANPTPEIHPSVARAGGAAVIATGRSDFPNQINNVLAFPGIFRGRSGLRRHADHRGDEAGCGAGDRGPRVRRPRSRAHRARPLRPPARHHRVGSRGRRGCRRRRRPRLTAGTRGGRRDGYPSSRRPTQSWVQNGSAYTSAPVIHGS